MIKGPGTYQWDEATRCEGSTDKSSSSGGDAEEDASGFGGEESRPRRSWR